MSVHVINTLVLGVPLIQGFVRIKLYGCSPFYITICSMIGSQRKRKLDTKLSEYVGFFSLKIFTYKSAFLFVLPCRSACVIKQK